MKKIGFFGGSFDPIHYGHINLALCLREKLSLDEVWFVPTSINPHKSHIQPAQPHHRLAMIKIAIRSYPYFILRDDECIKNGLSYTVDTLQEMMLLFPSYAFNLLVGADAFVNFERWKSYEKIIALCPIYIATRGSEDQKMRHINPVLENIFHNNFIEIPRKEISSSEIRARIAKGLTCDGLLPEEVINYIKINQLYSLQISNSS